MKLLKDILYKVRLEEVIGNTNIAIESIYHDSRQVTSQSLFVALKGRHSDGHTYIDAVIKQGAIVVVCESLPEELKKDITYVRVNDSWEALAILAANFYNNPSEKLKIAGVTGTNGKTSIATVLYKLFTQLGNTVGLLSTVENKIGNKTLPSTHTTPDALAVQKLLAEMVKAGCTHCFMEVSSIAIDQKRVLGIQFDVAIFTNLTHDHLDYHGTFENYIKAKKQFFDQLPSTAAALINVDDKNGKIMVQNTKAKVYTYSMKSFADFKVKILEKELRGMHLNINNKEVWVRLTGEFNAYNVLSAYATSIILGNEQVNTLTALSTIEPIEGRFNTVISKDGITGIIDYAHTPDALQNIIESIRDVMKVGTKLITVVGCGGDRDTTKRPIMGKLASSLSDQCIFTSDNPRSEDPNKIIADMKEGLSSSLLQKTLSITDREEAIRTAVSIAKPGDVILVAGKGHEKYQEANGVRKDFDDKKVITETFNNRA